MEIRIRQREPASRRIVQHVHILGVAQRQQTRQILQHLAVSGEHQFAKQQRDADGADDDVAAHRGVGQEGGGTQTNAEDCFEGVGVAVEEEGLGGGDEERGAQEEQVKADDGWWHVGGPAKVRERDEVY